MVHLQCLQEDGPEPGLHQSKGTLNDRACLRMMAVEVLGCHTLHLPLVGIDEGEWMLEAPVPTVCKDEVPWRRVWPFCTVGCPEPGQPTYTCLQIGPDGHNCLQDDGSKQFPVSVAVTTRALDC